MESPVESNSDEHCDRVVHLAKAPRRMKFLRTLRVVPRAAGKDRVVADVGIQARSGIAEGSIAGQGFGQLYELDVELDEVKMQLDSARKQLKSSEDRCRQLTTELKTTKENLCEELLTAKEQNENLKLKLQEQAANSNQILTALSKTENERDMFKSHLSCLRSAMNELEVSEMTALNRAALFEEENCQLNKQAQLLRNSFRECVNSTSEFVEDFIGDMDVSIAEKRQIAFHVPELSRDEPHVPPRNRSSLPTPSTESGVPRAQSPVLCVEPSGQTSVIYPAGGEGSPKPNSHRTTTRQQFLDCFSDKDTSRLH